MYITSRFVSRYLAGALMGHFLEGGTASLRL